MDIAMAVLVVLSLIVGMGMAIIGGMGA